MFQNFLHFYIFLAELYKKVVEEMSHTMVLWNGIVQGCVRKVKTYEITVLYGNSLRDVFHYLARCLQKSIFHES